MSQQQTPAGQAPSTLDQCRADYAGAAPQRDPAAVQAADQTARQHGTASAAAERSERGGRA